MSRLLGAAPAATRWDPSAATIAPLSVHSPERCAAAGLALRVPRPRLCTDNGAMVAALGAHLVAGGAKPSSLDLPADSSMPVTEILVG